MKMDKEQIEKMNRSFGDLDRTTPEVIYHDYRAKNLFVMESTFRGLPQKDVPLPDRDSFLATVPKLSWESRPDIEQCWQKTWELAYKNIVKATPENGFLNNYIDTAFNGDLFMWDSCFILMFARYGSRAFPFQQTLGNFYHRQDADGYMSRQLHPCPNGRKFHAHDPISTGPNVMTWCEWEYFLNTGDKDRLAAVFPCLVGFHQWMRNFRSWPDGTYWSNGLACGMDNQTRVDVSKCNVLVDHGHLSWLDATAQALISAQLLCKMAEELGREDEMQAERDEIPRLEQWLNEKSWNTKDGIYQDVDRDGQPTGVKSVVAFWPLMAGVVPVERQQRLADHLNDPKSFNRKHRVPTLAADDPRYCDDGGYWLGAVWPPTNYMVLRGLTAVGNDELAFDIGLNHLENVVEVFRETETVWENYAPETAKPGRPAKGDFVGWGGVGPVAVLLEYVIGLRPDAGNRRLVWDIRQTDSYSVSQYPFGVDTLIDLAMGTSGGTTSLTVVADGDLTLEVRYNGATTEHKIASGEKTVIQMG